MRVRLRWLGGRGGRAAAVTALLMVLGLQLVHVARVYSANWDEAHHLYDGYSIWTRHDYRLNAEVPPLVKLVAALPVLALHPQAPPMPEEPAMTDAFVDGRTFLVSNGEDRLLFPARMACVLLTLLTGWLIYAWGRSLFGTLAGLVALGMFAFDPLVLAHGSLVSTDMGSACFLFAACFAFYRYTLAATWQRLLLTGLVAGLALVAKFTGILVVPMLLLLAVVEGARLRSWRVLGQRLAACAGMLFLAWVVVWAFYGFRYGPAPGGMELTPRLGPYLASLPNAAEGVRLAMAARWRLLPEAYIWGLANTRHIEWEYTSYFFGRVLRHGTWVYFPAAFLIKSTLPLLVLLVVGVWVCCARLEGWSRRFKPRNEYWQGSQTEEDAERIAARTNPLPQGLKPRDRLTHTAGLKPRPFQAEQNPMSLGSALAQNGFLEGTQRCSQTVCFLLVPVGVYFAVITMSHFDIGARHMMPMYPFLYVLAGAVAAWLVRSGRVGAGVVGGLLVWQVVTSVRVAPAYMAYGNEAWGGPLQVRRYLSDANVDWGQQLKTVRQYLDENHVTDCWFAYFPDGAVEPQDYGVHCRRLPTPSGLWWMQLPMEVPPVIEGTVLISESDLDGVESGDGPLNPYEGFRGMKPVAVLQGGVYVYQGRFAVPLASAWVEVRRSADLMKAGDKDAALAAAQRAVALAPNQAETQETLGNLLAARGDWRGALMRFEAAKRAFEANRPELEEDDTGVGLRRELAEARRRVPALNEE